MPTHSSHMRAGIVLQQEEKGNCISVGSDNHSEDFILVPNELIWAANIPTHHSSHYQDCDHRWGMKCRWTGKIESFAFHLSFLSSMMVWCNACSTTLATPNLLFISCSTFPSLMNKNPRYINSFAWDRRSLLNWRQSTVFQQRTMAMWVLTLIPTGSHSATNLAGFCWRSKTEEASKGTSVVTYYQGK